MTSGFTVPTAVQPAPGSTFPPQEVAHHPQPPQAMTLVSVIDVLCTRHQRETIEHGWPIAGDLMALQQRCYGCWEQAGRQCRAQGTNHLRAIPFPHREGDNQLWAQVAAIHEAGHAVLGVLAGHRLLSVHIRPDRSDGAAGHAGGAVNWKLAPISVLDHLSMTAAGEHAVLRWLRNHHMDTPTNIIDARFGGLHDLIQAATLTVEHGRRLRTGHDHADRLLREHWDQVERVAALLVAESRVPGDHVHALVNRPSYSSDRRRTQP
jgi:hypothetical protein